MGELGRSAACKQAMTETMFEMPKLRSRLGQTMVGMLEPFCRGHVERPND